MTQQDKASDLLALVGSGRIRIYDEQAPFRNRYRDLDDVTSGLLTTLLRQSSDIESDVSDASSDRGGPDTDSSEVGNEPDNNEGTTELHGEVLLTPNTEGDIEGPSTTRGEPQEQALNDVVQTGSSVRDTETESEDDGTETPDREEQDPGRHNEADSGSESGSSSEVHESGHGAPEALHYGTFGKFGSIWD